VARPSVAAFGFDDLVLDVVREIVSRLDLACKTSFALTSKAHYVSYFGPDMFGSNSPKASLRHGHVRLFEFSIKTLGCPFDTTKDFAVDYVMASKSFVFSFADVNLWDSILSIPGDCNAILYGRACKTGQDQLSRSGKRKAPVITQSQFNLNRIQ
jgi:hypothetical protein